MARLDRYFNGKWQGSLILRQREYLVGRDPDCDMVLQDKLASRRHFTLAWQPEGGYQLKDLSTPNGTLVDGIKEFSKKLTAHSTIQVGQELVLFQAYDSAPEEVPGQGQMPAWTSRDAGDATFELDMTAHMAPSMLQRLQARIRSRQRPHLLLQRGGDTAVFPLDTAQTEVGFGPVRASLGPSEDGKPHVLAELLRDANGAYRVKAKGFFARIEVNGQSKKEVPLRGGEKLKLGGLDVEFHYGLERPVE